MHTHTKVAFLVHVMLSHVIAYAHPSTHSHTHMHGCVGMNTDPGTRIHPFFTPTHTQTPGQLCTHVFTRAHMHIAVLCILSLALPLASTPWRSSETHTHTHTYTHKFNNTHTHTHVHMTMRAFAKQCVHKCTHRHTHARTNVRQHTHTHTHTSAHTPTHTITSWRQQHKRHVLCIHVCCGIVFVRSDNSSANAVGHAIQLLANAQSQFASQLATVLPACSSVWLMFRCVRGTGM